MLTDTHCHIFEADYDNVKTILNNLQKNNIKRVIINGYNHQTNQEVIKLIDEFDNVYGALGIHPNEIKDVSKTIEFIRENIHHPKIIAIGEIGLDYYWNKDKLQIEKFSRLLDIAQEFKKPVIIHNRDATKDMLEILSKYKLKGIMHCFTENEEVAQKYIDMGFKLGINGIVTFKNSELPNVLSKIDIKNILLETDAPYITPEPYRKFKNEPKYLNSIAKKLEEIYGLNYQKLTEKLEQNYRDIFDL